MKRAPRLQFALLNDGSNTHIYVILPLENSILNEEPGLPISHNLPVLMIMCQRTLWSILWHMHKHSWKMTAEKQNVSKCTRAEWARYVPHEKHISTSHRSGHSAASDNDQDGAFARRDRCWGSEISQTTITRGLCRFITHGKNKRDNIYHILAAYFVHRWNS